MAKGKASEESILARYDDDPERQAITHYEAASQVYIREASLATRP